MDHRTKTMEAWQSYRNAEEDQKKAVQHNRETLGTKVVHQVIGGIVSSLVALALFGAGFALQGGSELGFLLSVLSLVGAAGAAVVAIHFLVEQSDNRRELASDCAEIPQQRLHALLDAVSEELHSAGYTIAGVDYEKKLLTTSRGNVTLGQENDGNDLLILLDGKRVMHSYSADREAATDIDGNPITIRSGIADTL